MKRYSSLFILLLSFLHVVVRGQISDPNKSSFANLQSTPSQEKLFVHIDRGFYLTGETVWYKIYAVDASFHQPIAVSRIAYIEILNKDLKPVIQTKTSMSTGTGNGSIIIPGFLPTGNYIFRAYTSWMKNFPPEFYYQQQITIVNTGRGNTISSEAKSLPVIRFFPEGGNLVAGIATKIAFKATDGMGQGMNCSGVIINEQNDTVAKFKSSHAGMGSFPFKGSDKTNYYALVAISDTLIKQKLPPLQNRGFTMNISEHTSEKITVSVHSSSELNTSEIFLVSHTRQVINNVQTARMQNGGVNFQVNLKDLGDGISVITLFNQDKQPVCERLVFKRPENIFQINTSTNQSVYETRSPVIVKVTSQSKDQILRASNLSMSVFLLDSLQSVPEENITNYLYLCSELKGKIENPAYYFEESDSFKDEALDNLLLTQGWRRFRWEDVMQDKKPAFEFLPEFEGPVVNGKIVNKLTGALVSKSDGFVSIPGADNAFSSATSNTQGNIRFAFKDVYKNNLIIAQPALAKDSNYRIDLTNSYSDKFTEALVAPSSISRKLKADLENRNISAQVENTFDVIKKRKYTSTFSDTTSFYGRPDRIYNLDDFTRFQTMEEVLREYVDDVRVRKEGIKFTFKVRNRLFGTYFEDDPLILLDGVYIGDATKIVALDPMKIRKIEVVTHRYYTGSSGFDGIVNIKSYDGELGVSQIDPNSMVLEFDGIQQQREFYAPDYSFSNNQKSHMPDFRTLLFWAPQINASSTGMSQLTFYSSDLKGKYALVTEGLSTDGHPVHALSTFEVK